MSPVLRYHTGGGVYADISGTKEEVTISASAPPVATDLWVDTDDDSGGTANLLSGFRNVVCNGDMMISQRGNGPFTAGGYITDGWINSFSGGTMSTTRTVTNMASPSPAALVTTIAGQSAAGDLARLIHPIEDVHTFAGSIVTCSFSAMASTAGLKMAMEVEQGFGTGGSPSATVPTFGGTVTLSTTMTRYSVTFVVPSIVGKTLGTNPNSVLNPSFWFSSGSSFASRTPGLGIQNGTFTITDVQLEEGSVATPFERIPIQQQLAWCQRYFRRVGYGNASVPTSDWEKWANGFCYGAGSAFITMYFPPMRVAPTSTSAAFGPSRYMIAANSQTWEVTSLPVDQVSAAQCSWLSGVTPSTLPTGQGCVLMRYGSSPTYIDFSAEL